MKAIQILYINFTMTRKEILLQNFYMGSALERNAECITIHKQFNDFWWGRFVNPTETKADLYFIYDIYNT